MKSAYSSGVDVLFQRWGTLSARLTTSRDGREVEGGPAGATRAPIRGRWCRPALGAQVWPAADRVAPLQQHARQPLRVGLQPTHHSGPENTPRSTDNSGVGAAGREP